MLLRVRHVELEFWIGRCGIMQLVSNEVLRVVQLNMDSIFGLGGRTDGRKSSRGSII